MPKIIPLLLLLSAGGCGLLTEGRFVQPFTPLIDAARAGDTHRIQTLIEAGADPNLPGGSKGWHPLIHAISCGEGGAVEALLLRGADPNLRAANGETPLMIAAGFGQTDIVALLLQSGADPYARVRHGITALDTALIGIPSHDVSTVLRCQPSTVRVLLDHAPDITYYGDLAEVLTIQLKHCSNVDSLLQERDVSRLRPLLRGRRWAARATS